MSARALAEFAAFEGDFHRAVEAAGGAIAERLFVAGVRIEVRFAGAALSPFLVAPFRHQVNAFEGVPDLLIQAWDSQSTGVALSATESELEEHQLRGMPSVPPRDGVYAAYLRPDPGLSMLNLAEGRGVYWLPNAERVPFEDRSGPFRGILNWWMSQAGKQFIHAAAIGTEGGAALIVGASGSGKSTTALSCMLAGMLYLGDDYCLLEPGDPPLAHSLFLSAKLHAGHLERFPELVPAVINSGRLAFEKGVLDLNLLEGVRVRKTLPIRAVLVPKVTHEPHTSLEPIGRAAALAALAPSTMLQLASTRDEALRRMADVVRSVPAFRLNAGTVLEEIPVAITRLLKSLTADAADE